jgi:hypothetical protein
MDVAQWLNCRRQGMEIILGGVIALAVSMSATFIGFDRERAFYPIVMIVIASYYGLFAVVGGSGKTLLIESVFITAFVAAAVLGYKLNLWFVVAALTTHGVFDLYHGHLVHNPGVPAWWPMFCLVYDIFAAAYLAWLLASSRLSANVS